MHRCIYLKSIGLVGFNVVLAMDQLDELMESEDVTWRDILYEVLKGMNPWDVDLVELATRYSQKVDEMREMNFRIPANVVLVCSVLLRMKADILTPREDEYLDYATALNFIFNSDYPISALVGGEVNAAPVVVGTMLTAAALALLKSLCGASWRRWSAV